MVQKVSFNVHHLEMKKIRSKIRKLLPKKKKTQKSLMEIVSYALIFSLGSMRVESLSAKIKIKGIRRR